MVNQRDSIYKCNSIKVNTDIKKSNEAKTKSYSKSDTSKKITKKYK